MSITRRFIALLAIGIVFLALAAVWKTSLGIFIIYNLICAALLIIDYFISPESNSISIERKGDENLSIYEKEAISFTVYNKSDFKLYVELKDEIPEFHFKAEAKLMMDTVKPHEKREFKYFVVPTKRGN